MELGQLLLIGVGIYGVGKLIGNMQDGSAPASMRGSINIVMLGVSNAGKTSYMATMYEALHQPAGDFQVKARRRNDHRTLMNQAKNIRNGIWPKPTDQKSCYEFILYHKGSAALPFIWNDYRGGALLESGGSDEVDSLHKSVKTADAVMLFVPAGEATSAATRIAVSRMQGVLRRSLADTGRIVPVAVVISKADSVTRAMDEAMEQLLLPIRNLIASSTTVVGTIHPIACLPNPRGIHATAYFCLRYGLAELFRKEQVLYNKAVAERDQAMEQQNIFNDIASVFTKKESARDKRKRMETVSSLHLNKAERLDNSGVALDSQLNEISTF